MTKSPEKVPRSMGSEPSWFGPPGPTPRRFCPVRTQFRTYRLVLGKIGFDAGPLL